MVKIRFMHRLYTNACVYGWWHLKGRTVRYLCLFWLSMIFVVGDMRLWLLCLNVLLRDWLWHIVTKRILTPSDICQLLSLRHPHTLHCTVYGHCHKITFKIVILQIWALCEWASYQPPNVLSCPVSLLTNHVLKGYRWVKSFIIRQSSTMPQHVFSTITTCRNITTWYFVHNLNFGIPPLSTLSIRK